MEIITSLAVIPLCCQQMVRLLLVSTVTVYTRHVCVTLTHSDRGTLPELVLYKHGLTFIHPSLTISIYKYIQIIVTHISLISLISNLMRPILTKREETPGTKLNVVLMQSESAECSISFIS